MPLPPPHAFRSRHAPWWALVAMCLVVLGPLIGQVSGQMGEHHGTHHSGSHAGHHGHQAVPPQAHEHAAHAQAAHTNDADPQPAHVQPTSSESVGLADACGYCSLYQHVPVLTLLLVLAALAGPIRRQTVHHGPSRGHSRPAIFPQALTRAPPSGTFIGLTKP